MKFKTKLFIIYAFTAALTVPSVVYAFCCGIMWVCLYGALISFVTIIISLLVISEMRSRQRTLTTDAAHELRTPLACLRANIEALIDGVTPVTPEKLEILNSEVCRLASLVDDLNFLSDIEWENVRIEKTRFDIADLARKTTAGFERTAFEKGIKIILNTRKSTVYADYNRTKQALINIISNALKYTYEGTITIATQGREITVRDTGEGIAANELPHIFERFYRVDKARSRETGGSGVGLTIALALMKAQGGTIKVKSDKTKGSEFRLVL